MFYRFRWVECQIKSLQACPCSEYHLEHLLNSLPRSLDETYERMLCSIDDFLIEDARRILTLLCFTPRALTVQELIDAIAVEINDSPRLNYKRRLQDFHSIREICGGFIESGPTTDHTNEIYHKEELTQSVRIAHFSVQEYLVSERIRNQEAAKFSLTSVTAHGEIAKICLIYLLEHGLSSSTLNESHLKALDESTLKVYPLAKFAAFHWYHHYQRTVKHDLELDDLILKLFQIQDSYVTWLVLYEKNRPSFFSFDFRRNWEAIPTPIYYASFMGLDQVLDHLVNSGQVEDATIPALQRIPSFKLSRDVNAQDGQLDKALQAASYGGHEKAAQILLNKGADINARGGFDGSALYAASERGHEKVVQMLLNKGANINAQGGIYGNALQVASYSGHEKVVTMLLNKGADVVAQDGDYGSALYLASYGGHEKIVQMLLDKGADVNAQQGSISGNALTAASSRGHKKVVQMLLDKGADLSARGRYGSAPQAASYRGHEKVVQIPLDEGADVYAPGGDYSNALAALNAHLEKETQPLRDYGSRFPIVGPRSTNGLDQLM